MTAHAKLSASGSAKWLNCPGSIKAEESFPDKSSSFADEGTVAHATAERILEGALPSELLGTFPVKGINISVSQDMLDNVQVYVDYVRSLPGERLIEVRVDFSDWVPEGFGTSDAIVINGTTMFIVDLKYGKGVPVYAESNTQAMLYGLGALADYGAIYDIRDIVLVIVQPRLDNISEWEISTPDLLRWGHWVAERAELALTDDAPRNPGEKQCQWCKAKATCSALLDLTHKALASEFDDLCDTNTLTDSQLKFVLENKKLISSWLEAVEELVQNRLFSGGVFEGYKLVEGRSTRSWKSEDAVAPVLSALLDEDQVYSKKMITPAQAEKLLGKKNSALIVDHIDKPEGKPTLALSSDKRPAVNVDPNSFDVFNS